MSDTMNTMLGLIGALDCSATKAQQEKVEAIIREAVEAETRRCAELCDEMSEQYTRQGAAYSAICCALCHDAILKFAGLEPEPEHAQRWREKQGHLLHDAECYWFGTRICTCGLLLYLVPRDDADIIYPSFGEHVVAHVTAMTAALKMQRPEPTPAPEES